MDRPTLARLRILKGQAAAVFDAVKDLHWYTEFESASPTFDETRDLVSQCEVLLRETEFAGVCPKFSPNRSGTGRQFMIAQDIKTIVASLNAALESILNEDRTLASDEAMQTIEDLQGRVIEAESRAMPLRDDQLRDRCQDLLVRPGKADTAVRDAAVILEDRIRKMSGLAEHDIGVDLVDKALNRKTGLLVVVGQDSERRSLHELYRGTIGFIKNPASHRILDYEVSRARQVVGFIDLLLQLLQETKRRGPEDADSADATSR